MARNDIHRPSAIQPEDYEFVAFSYLKIDDLGSALFLAEERKRLRAHMERSGGRYSAHEHGGLCHICGSVNAIYSAVFFHGPSGQYIKTGLDCATKLECEGVEAFRSKVNNALEASKGKRKAKAVLERIGLSKAWDVYAADAEKRADYAVACETWREAGSDEGSSPAFVPPGKDEEIVIDIVNRLIKWGDISDKAQNYLGVLCDRIARAPEIAAQRAAEADAAKPIPAFEGRVAVRGKVLSIKQPGEYDPYPSVKMLVQHADGWKLWGSVPAAIRGDVARGDEVEFVAGIVVSDRDPKFGFISRPSKAKLFKALAA